MAALYAHKDPLDQWALKSLREAGFKVRRVHRVYQPKHTRDGDSAEVLFEHGGEVFTALIEPNGCIVAVCAGW